MARAQEEPSEAWAVFFKVPRFLLWPKRVVPSVSCQTSSLSFIPAFLQVALFTFSIPCFSQAFYWPLPPRSQQRNRLLPHLLLRRPLLPALLNSMKARRAKVDEYCMLIILRVLDACIGTEQAQINTCQSNDYSCLCNSYGNLITW
jgi:hypothetical protein